MEGDRDREPGEDEVGGVVEREADRLGIAERPRAGLQRGERIVAEGRDDQARSSSAADEVEHRQQRVVGPARHLPGLPEPLNLVCGRRSGCHAERLSPIVDRLIELAPFAKWRQGGWGHVFSVVCKLLLML